MSTISYFDGATFIRNRLKKATYFRPFDEEVRALASLPYDQYAYRKLRVDDGQNSAVVFKDDQAVVVDLKLLKDSLVGRSNS